jgi:hypothetical protein
MRRWPSGPSAIFIAGRFNRHGRSAPVMSEMLFVPYVGTSGSCACAGLLAGQQREVTTRGRSDQIREMVGRLRRVEHSAIVLGQKVQGFLA